MAHELKRRLEAIEGLIGAHIQQRDSNGWLATSTAGAAISSICSTWFLAVFVGVVASSLPLNRADGKALVAPGSLTVGVQEPERVIVLCDETGFSLVAPKGARLDAPEVLAEIEKCHKANVQPPKGRQ